MLNLEVITIIKYGSSRHTTSEKKDNLGKKHKYFGDFENIKTDIDVNYNPSSAWYLSLYKEDVMVG